MNFRGAAWLKKGVIAGIGVAVLATALIGAGTASADDGKYCVAKNPEGKCVVYGTRPVIWTSGNVKNFVAAPEAPITIDPGYYDYLLSPKYYPYYCYNIAGYTVATGYINCYGYLGYYGGVSVTYANLPPATYAVVAAAADALNADRGFIYHLLQTGESLDRVTDRFNVSNSIFLTNFYNQLDARIAELRAVGAIQEWQAAALRNNVRNSWFITQTNLLQSLSQY
ncbi:MAG: hypothetical protein AB7P33_04040 [Dehalococcoidia bacterium]